MRKYFIIIMVTCAAREEAQKIVNRLLAKKLIACANIIPEIDSNYWWKGKLENTSEFLVMMKTVKGNFKKVEAEVKHIHSYDVPEVIAIPIIAGSKEYLSWIENSIKF